MCLREILTAHEGAECLSFNVTDQTLLFLCALKHNRNLNTTGITQSTSRAHLLSSKSFVY